MQLILHFFFIIYIDDLPVHVIIFMLQRLGSFVWDEMNPDLAQRFVDQHTNLLEAKEKFEACQSQNAHSSAPNRTPPQQEAPPNNSQAQNNIPNNNVKTVTFQEPPNTSQQN